MIDLQNAKDEFLKYSSNYDVTNSNIKRKIEHSLRVMEISNKIAMNLELPEEDVEIATLIGLLHDIARFEQYTIYKTFSDKNSIDHGDFGVKILSENNFIREFLENSEFDELIKTAIKNHNKFKIEDGLNERELLFTQIIRDADKIDIFYEAVCIFWTNDDVKEMEQISSIKESYLESIYKKESVYRDGLPYTKLDSLICTFSFVFDLNFDYSCKYILENGFIEKTLSRFNFKNEEIHKTMQEIKNLIIDYMKEKVKN